TGKVIQSILGPCACIRRRVRFRGAEVVGGRSPGFRWQWRSFWVAQRFSVAISGFFSSGDSGPRDSGIDFSAACLINRAASNSNHAPLVTEGGGRNKEANMNS